MGLCKQRQDQGCGGESAGNDATVNTSPLVNWLRYVTPCLKKNCANLSFALCWLNMNRFR